MNLVNLSHPVSHITQQDENYCWACAFAMILGRHSWAAALELALRCPASARNPETGALLIVTEAARSVHLTAVRAAGLTPATLAQRMRNSAVAVMGQYNSGDGDYDHVMVVTSLRGDLDDPEINIGVHDPQASGTRWTGPWNRFFGRNLILRRADWMVSR